MDMRSICAWSRASLELGRVYGAQFYAIAEGASLSFRVSFKYNSKYIFFEIYWSSKKAKVNSGIKKLKESSKTVKKRSQLAQLL